MRKLVFLKSAFKFKEDTPWRGGHEEEKKSVIQMMMIDDHL
jgi:hypothetical protein